MAIMTAHLFSTLLLFLLTLSGNVFNTTTNAQTLNCMEDIHGGNPSCTAQDFEFRGVTGFIVYDKLAQPPCNCNCWGTADCDTVVSLDGPVDCTWTNITSPIDCGEFDIGTVFGACLGNDDNVNVSLTVDFYAKNAVEDVGLYVSTGSNDALTGQCTIAALTPGTYGLVTVSETSTPANSCPDITGSGVLKGFPLNHLIFPCLDANPVDNYLDFDIALVFGGTSGCDPSGPAYPKPNTNSKCWYEAASRVKLKIHVPSFPTPSAAPSVSSMPSSEPSSEPSEVPSSAPSFSPSSMPSVQPSVQPSVAPSTSSAPSMSPSISKMPSSEPSQQPSVSMQPSNVPSQSPSISSAPSSSPSASPSVSGAPSSSPSVSPSVSAQPSSEPSQQPSVSAEPSSEPSSMPSTRPSLQPSSSPSGAPSLSPSATPSDQPSQIPSSSPSLRPSSSPSLKPSSSPSAIPSSVPTTSSAPSISSAPSSTTDEPSQSPSLSVMPSTQPSLSPTISSKPSISPSISPTSAPSSSPTGFPWYPDWTSTEQVCKNDALAPQYMKELQRMNYIYLDREECCRDHFWWRMAQCMGNERSMYYSDGTKCDSKVNFEDTELNSMTWVETTLFETVEDCCREKFWWDIVGCINESPKEIQFTLSIDIKGVSEPTNCQDADRIAQAMQDAANVGWNDAYTHAFVTSIGDVELSSGSEGTTECGGSLAGQSYAGSYDPKDGYPLDSNNVVSMTFKVSAKSSTCSDDACYTAFFDQLKTSFSLFAGYGLFTTQIIAEASEQGVPALFIALADATSIVWGTMLTAEMVAAESKSGMWYPNWENTEATSEIHKHTCTNDGREPTYMRENAVSYLFDSQKACCNTWFSWEDDCITSESVSTDVYYYPTWEDNTCLRKQEHEFKYWETDKFTTLDECCSRRFGWDFEACCATPGMGGCSAAASSSTVYSPDWTTGSCSPRSKALLEPWEITFAESTTNLCCNRHFNWDKKACCSRSGGC